MNVDNPLLKKIAHLAQLELDAQSEAAMLQDLNKIITWTEKLEEICTEGVQPLVSMTLEQNILRADTPQSPLAHDKALANAPSKDSNYFRVPKVKE